MKTKQELEQKISELRIAWVNAPRSDRRLIEIRAALYKRSLSALLSKEEKQGQMRLVR